MDDEIRPVVIDIGSEQTKSGFAGENAPRAVEPAVVGKPRHAGFMADVDQKDTVVGSNAIGKRDILTLMYPIEYGVISNWDCMENLLYHTLHDLLHVDPQQHPVFLTESPIPHRRNREKLTQLMFEKFNVPAMYLGNQAALSLYSSGRTTGFVVDVGASFFTIPIYEHQILSHAIQRIKMGGSELTEYLMTILNKSGHSLTTSVDREYVCDIKEKLCYVAPDFDEQMNIVRENSSFVKRYEKVDGTVITIGNERFRCPELLLRPDFLGKEAAGIPATVHECIMKCNEDIRKDLYANIVLSGGSSMFPGIKERMHKEMTALVPVTTKVEIDASPDRKYSAWIGGSVLASLPTFQNMWITKDEYEEEGPTVINRRIPVS